MCAPRPIQPNRCQWPSRKPVTRSCVIRFSSPVSLVRALLLKNLSSRSQSKLSAAALKVSKFYSVDQPTSWNNEVPNDSCFPKKLHLPFFFLMSLLPPSAAPSLLRQNCLGGLCLRHIPPQVPWSRLKLLTHRKRQVVRMQQHVHQKHSLHSLAVTKFVNLRYGTFRFSLQLCL